jgi:hypothetical protein
MLYRRHGCQWGGGDKQGICPLSVILEKFKFKKEGNITNYNIKL